MFKFEARFSVIIHCACDGFYQPIEKTDHEEIGHKYGYQKMQCDKCKHILFIQMGQETHQRDMMGEDQKCFSVLALEKEEE